MRSFKSGISGESRTDETNLQQITAAPKPPVTTTTSAEERTPEPIA
jgi:hypothetical protein